MTIPEWTRLENSAIIYPSCRTRKYAAMYRVSIVLDSEVSGELLDKALKTVITRFPSFRYTVKKGLFWWFLQKLENEPVLRNPDRLRSFDLKRNGGYMFRLSCEGARIDLDVFHALTDGTGAMTFLLSVAAEYLRLSGVEEPGYGKWVLDPGSEPNAAEMEDSFDRFSGTKGALDKERNAWHVRGKVEKPGVLNSLGVSVSTEELAAKAAEMECTVTELLSALILLSLQELRSKDSGRRKSPHLRLELPVNLRPLFSSSTHRNFSSYIYLSLDVTNGEFSLEDAVREIKYQKRLYVQPGRLTRRIAANVSLEDNMAIRCIPLFIKRPIINLINHLKGDRYATYTLSNLGKIELPQAMSGHVRDIHFILGRTRRRSGSCACVSFAGNLNLNFSRKIAEDDLERVFVAKLRELGIRASVSVPAVPLKPSRGWDAVTRPVFRTKGLFPKFLFSI